MSSRTTAPLRAVKRAVGAGLLHLLFCLLSLTVCSRVYAQAENVKEEPAACKVPALAEKLPFSACRKTLTSDAVSVAYLKGKQPAAPDAIAVLGPDLFGDNISLYNGADQVFVR